MSDNGGRHGDPRFYALLDEIAELHSRKNHDYAKTDEPLSNFTRARALGVEPWRGVLVRMSDKWSRIEQLAGGKTAKNESLRDSLIDLAVYALIDVLLLEDEPPVRTARDIARDQVDILKKIGAAPELVAIAQRVAEES